MRAGSDQSLRTLFLGACASALGFAASDASGQFLITSSGVTLWASHVDDGTGTVTWWLSKSQSYNPTQVQARLRDLAFGVMLYANDHHDQWPDLASELYAGGYVSDPQSFYNPGDPDPVPTAIDNDTPDAPNSALISFDFPGAGGSASEPPDTVMFADNTVANHAGLARCVVFADGHAELEPVWPHPFMSVQVDLTQEAAARMYRDATGQYEPYAFDLPAGAFGQAVVAPHRFELRSQGLLSQDVVDVFEAEGFDEVNMYSPSSSAYVFLSDAELDGPAGPAQAVTVYTRFESTLTRTPADGLDSSTLHIRLAWSDGGPQVASFATVFLTGYGLFTAGDVVLVEEQVLGPSDPGYVPDAVSMFVRGYAQLAVDVPVDTAGTLYLHASAALTQRLTPPESPERLGISELTVDLPATPAVDQLKFYAPVGYVLSVPDHLGPGDLALLVLRGDHNLDSQVDNSDRIDLIAARTGPLVGLSYVPGTFEELQTFDFDGDADIDCADYAALLSAWTGGGEPDPYPPCTLDADGDGVPTADDDCPGTPSGVAIDQRGCQMGDMDASGTIDLDDWSSLVDCMAGPYTRPAPTQPVTVPHCLNSFDYSADGDVDLQDIPSFLSSFTG